MVQPGRPKVNTSREVQEARRLPFSSVIIGIVLVYIWLIEGNAPREVVYIPGALVVALTVWHDVWRSEWGFAWRALLPGLRAALAITVPVAFGLVAIGAALGTLHDRRDFLGSLGALFAWGAAQQWVLQTVVLREAQRATSRTAGSIVAALFFAAVHMPNPFLAPVTGAAALVWCRLYDRYPNIVPLALSHALGTLAILYAFDETITGRLRIGASYLRL